MGKRKMIVTDLTRFSSADKVCVALIDVDSGQCFRPIPYFKNELCREHNLQPGAIFKGKMEVNSDADKPHVEDASYEKLKLTGVCTADDFKEVLVGSLASSVSDGFGYRFDPGQKHVPFGEDVLCSIVTVKVDPEHIEIHEDTYNSGRVKISFYDGNFDNYRYLSITDRGFYDYAMKYHEEAKLAELKEFIEEQDEVFLRVGLGRRFEVNGKDGFWLQVNGIYTFPDYPEEIRSY